MGKRIAVITQSQYPVEVRARRMAEACAARGHDVEVYCLRRPGELAEESINGVLVHRLPMHRKQGASALTYVAEYGRFMLAVGALMSRWRVYRAYDLIQVHNPPDSLAFATLMPKLFGRARVLVDIRDLAPELYLSRFRKNENHWLARILRGQERLACKYADAVTVCTTHAFTLLAGRGVHPQKMTVVMNCPDELIFDRQGRATPEPGSSGSDGCYRLVYHGGILERYGPDLIVRALPGLSHSIPGLCLDIYGEGDFLPAVQTLADELGVGSITHFHGFVPTEVIPSAVRKADVGVVPMRKDIFTDCGLPTKLLELAALEVPAVVSRTVTTNEYFDDNMVHYFAPGDTDDLTAKILDLYHHPERARALAANAHRFTERFNWSGEKATYLALVDRLLRG